MWIIDGMTITFKTETIQSVELFLEAMDEDNILGLVNLTNINFINRSTN